MAVIEHDSSVIEAPSEHPALVKVIPLLRGKSRGAIVACGNRSLGKNLNRLTSDSESLAISSAI